MMKKKNYKITFALEEGYADDAKRYTLSYAGNAIKHWMEQRLAGNLPVVTGLLQQGSLFFPAVNAARKGEVTVSPTAVYYGELTTGADLKRKNKEVRRTLESLATHLKICLKQESVYIVYRDVTWCI